MTNQRMFFSLCLLKQSRPLDHMDVSKNGPNGRSVPTDDLSFLFSGQTFASVRPSQPYDPRPLRSVSGVEKVKESSAIFL